MYDPSVNLYDKCVCGNPKRLGHEFCVECNARQEAERKHEQEWLRDTFGFKYYVVVSDPDGLMRPGAEFDRVDLAGMLALDSVSPDMLVLSRQTKGSKPKTPQPIGSILAIRKEAKRIAQELCAAVV